MSTISQLYNNLVTLMNQTFSKKSDLDNSISSHNNDSSAHSTEMAKKVNINQGNNNASKNVVTDSSGNITVQAKPSIPSKTSDLTNDSGFLTAHQDISGKANIDDLATVATSGSYNDLSDRPAGLSVDNSLSSSSENPVQNKVINSALNGKANSSHNHTKSEITDFPSTMAPSSHTHNTGELSDTSDYSNIGSAANATQKTINDKINTALGNKANSSNVYSKSETDTLLNGKVDTSDSRLTDSRTPKSHTHGNITNTGAIGSTANLPIITTTSGKLTTGSFGTAANTFCQGNDSRLSDARTPTSHTHGNLTNEGKVGSTADYFVYTTTGGAITSKQKIGNITTSGAIGSTSGLPLKTTTSGVITTGSFGTTSGTFCQGNDSRLHTHTFTYSNGSLTIS